MVKKKKIQTLVFDKKVFKNKRMVKEFIKKNNFRLPKKKDSVRKYGNFFRVRQREPSRFNKATFRQHKIIIKKKVIKGVYGVSGYLR